MNKLLLSTIIIATLALSACSQTSDNIEVTAVKQTSSAPVIVTKAKYPTIETSRQFAIQIEKAGGITC